MTSFMKSKSNNIIEVLLIDISSNSNRLTISITISTRRELDRNVLTTYNTNKITNGSFVTSKSNVVFTFFTGLSSTSDNRSSTKLVLRLSNQKSEYLLIYFLPLIIPKYNTKIAHKSSTFWQYFLIKLFVHLISILSLFR